MVRKTNPTDIVSYTDGSLLEGRAGCGVHTIMGNRVIYNGNFYLGTMATVFQAEVTAINKSAKMLSEKRWLNKTITFYTDSQACMLALNNITVKSKTVEKCINDLNVLGENNTVHIRWVKAHIGTPGNECADFLAKKGSTLGTGNNGMIETPLTVVKRDIDKFYYNKWKAAWLQYKSARQTKIWFQEPDQNKSKELLNLDRNKLSILVQFITGHNRLMRHSNLQEGIEDPYSCRFCLEDEETSYHLIAECPELQATRWTVFQAPSNLEKHPSWTVKQLNMFLEISKVGKMLQNH